MKILELRASNIKNLKVVEIKTGGKSVTLTGANGVGKSAVLDSILLALTGGSMSGHIRNGETKAETYVDLGEYQVRKVSTPSGDRLEVKTGDMVAKSPQALLNKLLGQLTFDPLAFLDLDEKKQREILLKLIGVDLATQEAARKAVFDERTIANREVKRLEGVLSELTEPKEGTPVDEISAAKVMEELTALQNKDKQYSENEFLYQQSVTAYEQEKQALLNEIEQLEESLSATKEALTGLTAPGRESVEAVPGDAIGKKQKELAQVEQLNKIIRLANAYRDAKESELEAVAKADNLTDDLALLENEKEEALSACKMPIEGLGVEDDRITMKGVPVKTLSTGEQIRVSVAIAMALNPTLKVILVREGSLLDKDGLKAIQELVAGKGYQLWIERVGDNGEVGVIIESGEVEDAKEAV